MAELTQEEIDALLNGGVSAPAADTAPAGATAAFSPADDILPVGQQQRRAVGQAQLSPAILSYDDFS